MKLDKLIKGIDFKEIIGGNDLEISEIKTDSNQVAKGSMFICLRGKDYDGHDFVKQAEKYGAVAVVTEKKIDTAITQIVVKDTRIALSRLASKFYGSVDKKMKLIAVIGTNGKTTTAHLIKKTLEECGVKCGVIGTLGSFYLDKYIENNLTTPDPLELHKILFDMFESGVRTVVMEVSAHAIYFQKVYGIKFYCAVFTNFSQDHLDFFSDMENYKQAKLNFFKNNFSRYIITNSDDEVGREIAIKFDKAITYGIDNPADVFAIEIKESENYTEFVINLFDYIYRLKLNLIGNFNVYNALAAGSTVALLGIKPELALLSLEGVKSVSGRLERVYNGDYKVYIDYAHTPDGLKEVLSSLSKNKSGKLICVFGCGGNRDVGKRALMGSVSAEYSDFTIITSDNPRFEEPMFIINEIERGVLKKSKNYVAIEDRAEAIKYAIDVAKIGDVILIAGKGAESYQEVLGIKKLYNDKDTVIEYLRSKGF